MAFFSRSALVVLCTLGIAQAASITVYLSPPGDTASVIPGVVTETFDDPALLTLTSSTGFASPIGTYLGNTPRVPVILADQYGGAGNSAYMYVGSRQGGDSTSVALTLATPADYFGFWWSAGDALNRISVYSNGVLVAQFQTSDITDLLANNPLYALNGTTYPTSAYYGNPNSGQFHGQDNAEPFAYVNLVANGFTFDKLVLDNNGSSGFENDNNSVFTGTVNIPRDFPSFVKVVDVPFINDQVPEPGYSMLLGLLFVGTTYYKMRRAAR